jgi:hypothetical protein
VPRSLQPRPGLPSVVRFFLCALGADDGGVSKPVKMYKGASRGASVFTLGQRESGLGQLRRFDRQRRIAGERSTADVPSLHFDDVAVP